MASIKVNTTTVIRACKQYDDKYQDWVLTQKKQGMNDDCAWITNSVKSNHASTVRRIRRMADAVHDTPYPYVILSAKDFEFIGNYLGE